MKPIWMLPLVLTACPGASPPPAAPAPAAELPAEDQPRAGKAPRRTELALTKGDAPLSPTARAFVDEHNAVRARHCAPPLTWSPELEAVATRWAEHLRDNGCGFDHSQGRYGENLAAGTSGSLGARSVVGMWAEERFAYDFSRGGFSMETGHFTQVVWRGTTHVGCGTATCNGMDLWVCNYAPAGNVEGEYDDNVLQPGC